MKLRPYQQEAVNAVIQYLKTNDGNPIVSAATGTGKSVMIASLIKRIMDANNGVRVMVASHVAELLVQNASKLSILRPETVIRFYSAQLGKKDIDGDAVFAGIQSVYREKEIGRFNLLIIDEVHTLSRKDVSMWQTLINKMKEVNPKLRIIGFSATPFRLDSGSLTSGDDALFHDIVYDYGLGKAIDDGYLCSLSTKSTKTIYSIEGVGKLAGEFNLKELEAATNVDELTRSAVSEMIERAQDRKSWLIFCNGVQHSFAVADELRRMGIISETVTGETPEDERDRILEQFKSGQIRAVTNNAVWTTGVDIPNVDMIGMLRFTMSGGLLLQMAGRGTRVMCDLSPYETATQRRQAIKESSKPNCIASGQRVLTDFGLIPIEKITKNMKVWDGVDFVSHGGIVFQGKRKVIQYAGLTATEDHKVWTKEGWKTFGECFKNKIWIAKTGNGWKAVKLSENYFARNFQGWQSTEATCFGKMSIMWRTIFERISKLYKKSCWMQKVRKKNQFSKAGIWCSKMAVEQMQFSKTEMYKQKRSSLSKIWRQGDKIQIQDRELYGKIYNGQPWFKSLYADRQNKQQWTLRNWQHSSGKCKIKYEQPKNIIWNKDDALIPFTASRGKICRFNFNWIFCAWKIIRRSFGKIFQFKVIETEREVWDILNAGPRNSFTCEGLLVSNCLFLDFAGNIKRHGFLDQIKGKEKKEKGEGVAPMKDCPMCAQILHAAARRCHECGYEFPENTVQKLDDAYEGQVISADESKEVIDVLYFAHNVKKEGKTPCLKVKYLHKDSSTDEYVLLEHSCYPKQKALKWWQDRGGGDISNMSVKVIVDTGMCAQLKKPSNILVGKDKGGKWDRVKDYDFTPKPVIAFEEAEEISFW